MSPAILPPSIFEPPPAFPLPVPRPAQALGCGRSFPRLPTPAPALHVPRRTRVIQLTEAPALSSNPPAPAPGAAPQFTWALSPLQPPEAAAPRSALCYSTVDPLVPCSPPSSAWTPSRTPPRFLLEFPTRFQARSSGTISGEPPLALLLPCGGLLSCPPQFLLCWEPGAPIFLSVPVSIS